MKQKTLHCFSVLLLLCSSVPNRAHEFPPKGKNPLRVVAFGDSVVWGQGLHDHEKFYALVADTLANCAGVQVEKQVIAHSGATVLPNPDEPDTGPRHQEIPNTYPTINQQVDGFVGVASTVDLVILDGGINDVDVTWIIDPFLPSVVIEARSRRYCFEEMVPLLNKVASKFSTARIVVTGYYPIVSEHTDLDGFEAIMDTFGFVVGGQDAVIRNCRTFAEASRRDLQDAVRAVNAANPGRVAFADPAFGPENAAFAPASWLWGLRLDFFPVTNHLDPIDPWAEFRDEACGFFGMKCYRASMGHPTPRGARAYASAIAAALGFSWTDFSRTSGGDDRMEFPFHTLSRAVEHVPTGGTVLIKSGITSETIRITKPCKLEACAGPVVLGKTN